ncbi:alpha/beta hydrolase family protein [Amycolatopsis nigrescens]|uniref:alpha/beta hydrolase family protein n=1 Tax=Amycolatopsis nigrescens TaxID=381445 RepID=UPI00036E9322|nr:hypothetical protein [Amycolatopsis nigrescens]
MTKMRTAFALVVFAVCALLAPATAQAAGPVPATLPAATGKYAVGSDTLHLTDRSRTDPWVPESGPRQLMVSMFYPAVLPVGAPRQYLSTEEATLFLQGIPDVRPELVAATRSGARLAAPPVPRPHGFPLVVLSPGFGHPRSALTGLAEELASRGYVIALIGHNYESNGTQFPDGQVTGCVACESEQVEMVPTVRAADVSFVLDRLLGRDPAWAGRWLIDPRRIGMAGHSIGGNSASATMSVDRRVLAGVNMDGSFIEPVPESGLDRPFLMLGTAQSHTPSGEDTSWPQAWSRLTDWKRWLTVAGAGHSSFTDLSVLGEHFGVKDPTETISGARATELTRAYLVAFFEENLRGRPQPLLEGPVPANPEVEFWS